MGVASAQANNAFWRSEVSAYRHSLVAIPPSRFEALPIELINLEKHHDRFGNGLMSPLSGAILLLATVHIRDKLD